MNRSDFRREILAMHLDQPQRKALVDMALNGLFECLDKLATYGHALEVQPAEWLYGGEEFPKMMYHPQLAPAGRTFHTQDSMPTDVGWQDRPLQEEGEQQEEGDQQDATRGPRIDEPGSDADSFTYPKKLYHPDVPGGLDVQNAEMEEEYKERGYTDTPPDRGDVDHGSTTRRFEGTDGGQPERGQLGKQTPQATRPAVPAKPQNGKK